MTDQPELQAALIPLAEKAGYAIYHSHAMCAQGHEPTENCGKREVVGTGKLLPGADGTLTDAEVTVVLTWLAKAHIEFTGGRHKRTDEYGFRLRDYHANDPPHEPPVLGHGDTLNAALAAAVKALHEANHA